ncbi:MAG: M23 family metallopeptidase, partial [Candidatus Rokuibacteriota bacterium]
RPYFATVPSCPNPAGAGGTWEGHMNAVDPIRREVEALRAEGPYLLARTELGSCRDVPGDVGCVYDSYDAIAAAAHKLSADGADESLTSEGTRNAVCAYIGSCSEVDNCTGVPNQYCGVIPQAREWERLAKQIAAEEGASFDDGSLVSDGGSGKLAWPTPPRYRTVGGVFGEDREDHLHAGIDISLPMGTPITAAESGRVTHACRNVTPCSGYGNFVCVEHKPRLSTCYAHLLDFARGIHEGAVVKRGEVIGPGDSTGSSTGSHLHFEVRLGRYPAEPVDPMRYLSSEGSTA